MNTKEKIKKNLLIKRAVCEYIKEKDQEFKLNQLPYETFQNMALRRKKFLFCINLDLDIILPIVTTIICFKKILQ